MSFEDQHPYPDVIANRYELKEILSQGGMSTVFRAIDLEKNEECAIKLLSVDEFLHQEGRERFKHECEILIHFDHPNIIRCLDYGIYEDIPYLVMELCINADGQPYTLKQLQEESPNHQIPYSVFKHLIPQILRGMALFHQHGLVHRDLKPENILLKSVNGIFVPKIIDFGLIAVTRDEAYQKRMLLSFHMGNQSEGSDRILGTLNYMSPEQLAGKAVDARSDVYSFGLMLFRLLTGANDPILDVHALDEIDIPQWLKMMIESCLQPEPNFRPANADEVLLLLPEELRNYQVEKNQTNEDTPTVHQFRKDRETVILGDEPINGRYQVLESMNRGEGWSDYLCRDLKQGTMVELRVWHLRLLETNPDYHRFFNECEFIQGIRHPNLISLLDYGTYQDYPYIVREHYPQNIVDPRTLEELIQHAPNHTLSLEQICHFFLPILGALRELHRSGIVNALIYPDNILLVRDSQHQLIPKIRDFGAIAPLSEDGYLRMPSFITNRTVQGDQSEEMASIGYYPYMAPEVKSGSKPSCSSDVYSFGLMLYRAVTGFEHENYFLPSDVNPQLPSWVDDLCRYSLSINPENRAPNADELIQFLPPELQPSQADVVHQPVPLTQVDQLTHDEGEETEADRTLIPSILPPPEQKTTLSAPMTSDLPVGSPLFSSPQTKEEPVSSIPQVEIASGLPLSSESISSPPIPSPQESLSAARNRDLEPIIHEEVAATQSISVEKVPPPSPHNLSPIPEESPPPRQPVSAVRLYRKSKPIYRHFVHYLRKKIPGLIILIGILISVLECIYLLGILQVEGSHRFSATIGGNFSQQFMQHYQQGYQALNLRQFEKARSHAIEANRYAKTQEEREKARILLSKIEEAIQRSQQLSITPLSPKSPEHSTSFQLPHLHLQFRQFSPGTFQMGSNLALRRDWGPMHPVTITYPYWFSETEITQATFEKIMGENPSIHKNPSHPVENVTWLEAIAFCQKLTQMEPPQNSNIPTHYVYRLPTEAEWEYACSSVYQNLHIAEVGWFGSPTPELSVGSLPKRYPVASKSSSSSLPIHDMLGNVHEWCWDAADFDGTSIISSTYPTSFTQPIKDPVSLRGPYRIYRGGSVRSPPDKNLIHARYIARPTDRFFDVGFRVVLAPPYPVPSDLPKDTMKEILIYDSSR